MQMAEKEMKVSELAFKVCATAVVLLIAGGVVSCATGGSKNASAPLIFLGGIAAFAFVVGIVASIWE
jgi:hypothetical protein